ncbi:MULTISPECIES: PaaI family thioesterase [unclassified Pseudomonas]|uniref:PaaI family thioesterase n=1 Tax=unclassified Pseudomonas TaxID=196821 RepID=UPI0024473641|nr:MULTISPECIES: PaaI family thioesterase [unclassified Pseudomonas]MDG9926453.1 PaaI family thioesterase [Pseudomonas sp. GD04042]MDH0481463.1 PaaI family thioesterase [Pseudomonas sp. GD04015]MDH0603411.1 PaaI family thioesterase [Pseudomonas sp. GD03869]MDH0895178.1 PaaI family thioesterase [Pseudomonas sp. GD03875]MDH1064509.1 PaaI family thioesterase [Pseudomonas sp. GD03985]
MSEASPVGQDSNFSKLLGIRIEKAENGESVLRMSMQEHLLNLHGRMHGGALYSLIDTALGQASHSLFGGEAGSMTLECKVNYIRGVEAGEVVCHARVLNAGRKVHVLEARVEQGDKLIATAQATFICK